MTLDIKSNRKSAKYTTRVQFLRVLWGVVRPFFKYSPRTAFSWRCFLLRCMGAKIGRHIHIYNSTTIYMPWNLEVGNWSSIGEHVFIYNLDKLNIGEKSTISYRAHICCGTHDYKKPDLPLVKLPVNIGDNTWICTDAFISPGTKIGDGAIVAARAVVTKDVGEFKIVAGNPAVFIKNRAEINN